MKNNKCSMNNIAILCGEHNGVDKLCLVHNTIFDMWIARGGNEIYDNTSISLDERRNIFIKDLKSLNLDENEDFSDISLNKLDEGFKKIFLERHAR